MRSAVPAGWLIALLFPAVAAGQGVRGAVVDATSRTPVPGVDVRLIGPRGSVLARTASSSAGWFQLPAPHAGRFHVTATHPAWGGDALVEVLLAPAETLTVIIELAGTAIPLDSILVAARSQQRLSGFYQRSGGSGRGRYIEREDIEMRPHAPLSAHLAVVPGIRFERVNDPGGLISSILLMRSLGDLCMPSIYLDGLPALLHPGMEIDDLIASENLEGIEIYDSHLTAPLELHLPQDTCGVIALWSRTGTRSLTIRQMLGLGAVFTFVTILSTLLF